MMKTPIGVLLSVGTQCHEETLWAIEQTGYPGQIILLQDVLDNHRILLDLAALVVPGGFSEGDYFGSGRAVAMILGDLLQQLADQSKPIIGICNGFQILMEAGLFNDGEFSGGALVANTCGHFRKGWATLLAVRGSVWTEGIEGRILRMPYAHGEGRWYVPPNTIRHLKSNFHYVDGTGRPTTKYPDNPNGSPGGVTGLAKGLVMGMMPHPERAVRPELGSTDGRLIFDALVRLTKAA